jgi:hypothetical protein
VCVCVRVKNSPEFADEVVLYSIELQKKLSEPPTQPLVFSGEPCEGERIREMYDEDPSRFDVTLKDGGQLPLIAIVLADGMGEMFYNFAHTCTNPVCTEPHKMVSFSTWMQWLVFINQPSEMQHLIRRVLLVKASTSGLHFADYGAHLDHFGR